MSVDNLIIGVLHRPESFDDPDFAAKCRDFTVSCCRFDFFGPVVEGSSVDAILEQAARGDRRYCVVQSSGHVMIRYTDASRAIDTNFVRALADWVDGRDFLAAGRIVDGGERWYGLDELCFVVDLETYRSLGRPEFQRRVAGQESLPESVPDRGDPGGALRALWPASGRTTAEPVLPGWSLIAAGLAQSKPILGFEELLEHCRYDLRARGAEDALVFRRFRGAGIFDYDETTDGHGANDDWRGFLGFVQDQAKHAKRGVFLGNWETYEDVETPPPGFGGPVSSFYGVAAGFKPNRILETHGFDDATRVVFFDYSPVALAFRRALVEQWDGADYPAFVERAAVDLPDAFYQLWGNLWNNPTPGALNLDIVAAIWRKELAIWGGEAAFQRHWSHYRALPHHFVECDLFGNPRPLLETVQPGPDAVMWWSNAFHSLNGIWFYDLEQRQSVYRRWLETLAEVNPGLFLYGKDVDNLGIEGSRIRDHVGEL